MPAPSPYAPPATGARPRPGSGKPGRAGDAGDAALPNAYTLLAIILSILIPGLGHVYARRAARGAAWIALLLALSVLDAVAVQAGPRYFAVIIFVVFFGAFGLRLAATIDAALLVHRYPAPRAPVLHTLGLGVVILALTIANSLALRRFVMEAFKIPSGSMIPTLLVGEHIFVDKLRAPDRGDLLVFPFPEHPEQDFVKRIVGLPGDRITFREGRPIVNGVEVPSCLVGTTSYEETDDPTPKHEGTLYLEFLGPRAHLAFYDTAAGAFSGAEGPYDVGADEVFVLGDNRNNSYDSRMWWGGKGGGVPRSTMIGVPFVVWLSLSERGIDWSRNGLNLDEPHLPGSMASLAPALERCLAKGPPAPRKASK